MNKQQNRNRLGEQTGGCGGGGGGEGGWVSEMDGEIKRYGGLFLRSAVFQLQNKRATGIKLTT